MGRRVGLFFKGLSELQRSLAVMQHDITAVGPSVEVLLTREREREAASRRSPPCPAAPSFEQPVWPASASPLPRVLEDASSQPPPPEMPPPDPPLIDCPNLFAEASSARKGGWPAGMMHDTGQGGGKTTVIASLYLQCMAERNGSLEPLEISAGGRGDKARVRKGNLWFRQISTAAEIELLKSSDKARRKRPLNPEVEEIRPQIIVGKINNHLVDYLTWSFTSIGAALPTKLASVVQQTGIRKKCVKKHELSVNSLQVCQLIH